MRPEWSILLVDTRNEAAPRSLSMGSAGSVVNGTPTLSSGMGVVGMRALISRSRTGLGREETRLAGFTYPWSPRVPAVQTGLGWAGTARAGDLRQPWSYRIGPVVPTPRHKKRPCWYPCVTNSGGRRTIPEINERCTTTLLSASIGTSCRSTPAPSP